MTTKTVVLSTNTAGVCVLVLPEGRSHCYTFLHCIFQPSVGVYSRSDVEVSNPISEEWQQTTASFGSFLVQERNYPKTVVGTHRNLVEGAIANQPFFVRESSTTTTTTTTTKELAF